jgi:hypothetical protein
LLNGKHPQRNAVGIVSDERIGAFREEYRVNFPIILSGLLGSMRPNSRTLTIPVNPFGFSADRLSQINVA